MTLDATDRRDDEIVAGRLACSSGHIFAVENGIADFVGSVGGPAERSAVYDTFWQAHARQRYAGRIAKYMQKFQIWARLPEPLAQHFAGKVVLDAGCGEGRFTFLASALGATHVVGLDSSLSA